MRKQTNNRNDNTSHVLIPLPLNKQSFLNNEREISEKKNEQKQKENPD